MAEPNAGAGAPDPAVAVNGGAIPQVDLPEGWMLVPAPPPMTPDQLAASAAVHRAEARTAYEASLTAAAEAQAHGESIVASAEAMRAQADVQLAADLAYADSLDGGAEPVEATEGEVS
jgi:hypothetical protein